MDFRGFVDCHSHLAPTGDDGARTVEEGVGLARDAASVGTALLYLTPHVWPELRMHEARERRFREAVDQMRAGEGVPELRIGFELTPHQALLDDDPWHYVLEGTSVCLVESPFSGGLSLFYRVAEHVEDAGLTPLIAHPERSLTLAGDPALLAALLERGWPLQVTGASLTGTSGRDAERIGWQLLESSARVVVASDGHRAYRPATLDRPWQAAVKRLGEERAQRAFGGGGIPGLVAAPVRAAG